MRPTTITIDLPALAHNLAVAKAHAPTAKILAMVKANAYGHGAVACLPALQQADGLGVACLAEALPLRQAGWAKKIVLIEGAFSQADWQHCVDNNIDCVIHQPTQLDWALQTTTEQRPTIWLKLNTGMNRLGFAETQIIPIAEQLVAKGYSLVLTSHFANADVKDHPANASQIATFERLLTQLKTTVDPTIAGSMCNSAGIFNFPEQHHDWVRPGIMLYGATPLSHQVPEQTAYALGLRPVMHFAAQIMAVHDLQVGACVGYGSRWQAQSPSHIGIVSVGYADGYPRVVSEQAYVMADGKRLPIIGRVAMDMLMVDITAYPTMAVGQAVQLWGDTLPIDTVAQWNDTIGYELMCLVTQRPTWRYHAI